MVTLRVLPGRLGICRFDPNTPMPSSLPGGNFFCAVRTEGELSVVCDESVVPSGVRAQRGWRAFRVEGTLDFSLTGILASIANPLAEAKVSIFAVSTFDTDYVLVKEADLARATSALEAAGITVKP